MNRRTFFGFGFGLDRQAAYDAISKQLLLCRERATAGSTNDADAGVAAKAPTQAHDACKFQDF